MKRVLVLALATGCYDGLGEPTGAADSTSTGPAAAPPWRDDADAGLPASSSEESTGSDETADLAADEYDCIGVPVLAQLGEVLVVAPDASALELHPLQPGEGFTCMRVELTLVPSAIASSDEVCPVYVALASLRGTGPGGEDLAAAFVHAFDGEVSDCVRGSDRLAIGNFRELTDDVPAPALDEPLQLRISVQPFVSRIELSRDGVRLAHASADLYPATVEDTRDPVLRLGLPRVADGTVTPWYGARYSELRVFAEVVPP